MNAKRLALGALLLLGCGCSTMSNTDKGVLTGGGLGAVAGGLLGSLTGHAGAGAAIGGVLGGVAGGLTGNAVDQAEDARAEARAVAAATANQRPPLSVFDVVKMTQNHMSESVIINEIRQTGSSYNLTPDDLIWLRGQGVSDAVIMEMQTRRPQMIYQRPPPYYGREVVVVEPAPPPVAFGFGWSSGPRRYWR